MTEDSISLWIDTDSSGLVWTGLDCDDDLAMLVALALDRRNVINLQGISVCAGNAPLRHTWQDIHLLLDHAGSSDITPVKGYGWRSMNVPIAYLRYYDYVMPDIQGSHDASMALIDRSRNQDPFEILMLGPVTNLARAITGGLDPAGVSHIYLMDGDMTGQPVGLNFRSDRGGARKVIEADIPKTIITIQTCAQATVTESFLDAIECPSMAACALLPKMRQQIKLMPKYINPAVKQRMLLDQPTKGRWKASPNLDHGFVPWDIVALLSISHPDLFDEWEYHRVAFPTCDGGEPCDKTMKIVANLGNDFDGKNWTGVVRTPHRIRNETEILDLMFSLIGEISAASPNPPALLWGYCGIFVYAAVAFLLCLRYLFFRPSRASSQQDYE